MDDPAFYFRDVYFMEYKRGDELTYLISHEIKEEGTGVEVTIEQAIQGYREGKRYTMTNKWADPNNHIPWHDKYYRVDGVDFRLKDDQRGCNDWGVLRGPRHWTPRMLNRIARVLGRDRGNQNEDGETDRNGS